MSQTKINFSNPINSSLQVGDRFYVSDDLGNGITTSPKNVGEIVGIEQNFIIVDVDYTTFTTKYPSANDMFALFSKKIEVNDSSLKGYFADVAFTNYSNEYAELYSISSEVTTSSK